LLATQDTHVPGNGCRASAAAARTPASFRAAGEGPVLLLEPCAPHIMFTKRRATVVILKDWVVRPNSKDVQAKNSLDMSGKTTTQVHLLTYKAKSHCTHMVVVVERLDLRHRTDRSLRAACGTRACPGMESTRPDCAARVERQHCAKLRA